MTIASQQTYQQSTANGTATQFSFPNKIFSAFDLVVTLIDTLGNLYPFTNSGNNTFSNAASGLSYTVYNIDVDTGCYITFTGAPISGWIADMRTAIAELQSTSIKNQSGFLPELHEEFFDKATRMIQDLYRRTYLFGIHGADIETTPWPSVGTPAARANTNLGFGPAGALALSVALASGTLSAASIYSFIGPPIQAEINAGVTVVNENYPVMTVDRYGTNSVPGTTDMGPAIQAAVNVASQPSGPYSLGGTVNYLNGVYNIVTPVAYSAGYIVHQGANNYGTILVNGSAAAAAITVGNLSTPTYGGGFKNFAACTGAGVTAVNGNAAIVAINCQNFFLDRIEVNNTFGACFRGIVVQYCTNVWIRAVQVSSCIEDGITLTAVSAAYGTDCRSDYNGGSGWSLANVQGGYFKACTGYSNVGDAWYLASPQPVAAPNFNNFFHACIGDTSGNNNWLISDSVDSFWINCWGSSQLSKTVNPNANGFLVETANCKHLLFDACVADNNNYCGLNLNDPGSSAPVNISAVNCRLGSPGFNGINTGNGQAAGGGYGLTLNGAVSQIRVIGGSMLGNATAPILNTSSGTDIIIDKPIGYVTNNEGTSSVGVGNSTVTVTHGLGFTPTLANIQITPTSSLAASSVNSVWPSAPTSTQFTVNVNANVAGTALSFAWRAFAHGT